jgi:uncharacterized protein YodC (DUF2158 family)
MAAGDIQAGTTVVLKSGGPPMTVAEIDASTGSCWCQWFAGTKLEAASFSQEVLRPIRGATE